MTGEKVTEIQIMRRFQYTIVDLMMKGAMCQKNRAQPLHLQEAQFCQPPVNLEENPKSQVRTAAPADTLILV